MLPARCLGIAACGFLITACGTVPVAQLTPQPSAPVAASSPSSSPTSSQRGAPTRAASPTPPPPTPPAGTVCRIPYADISEAGGGFIALPSGELQADPNSVVALPGGTPGQIGQNPGLTYDVTLAQWVPVPRDWLAPDGQLYVYADFQGHNIHVVTVTDRSTGNVTTNGGWYLIAATDDGAYLGELSGPGAWHVRFGGTPNQVIDHGVWSNFSNGALWGFDASYNLIRHDATTGLETRWGQGSQGWWIAGFDQGGAPVVNMGGALAVYHPDGTKTAVFPGTNGIAAVGLVFADLHGLWFQAGANLVGAPGSGIYLWTPAEGAKLATAHDVHPAGGCSP